jgi:hypothetical protein
MEEAREESPTRDVILRRMQLEQENFAGSNALKEAPGDGRQKFTSSMPGLDACSENQSPSVTPIYRRIQQVSLPRSWRPLGLVRFSSVARHYGIMAYEDVERLQPCAVADRAVTASMVGTGGASTVSHPRCSITPAGVPAWVRFQIDPIRIGGILGIQGEEQVTIAAGFLCNDGVVLSADTQMTASPSNPSAVV